MFSEFHVTLQFRSVSSPPPFTIQSKGFCRISCAFAYRFPQKVVSSEFDTERILVITGRRINVYDCLPNMQRLYCLFNIQILCMWQNAEVSQYISREKKAYWENYAT